MSKHQKKMSLRERLYWMGYDTKETIREFWTFLRRMNGYRKLDLDYGYDPEDYRFILDNYSSVLTNRTKMMSKPTYFAYEVIEKLDEWYDEHSTGFWIEEALKEGDRCRIIRCSECMQAHIVCVSKTYDEWCRVQKYCRNCGVRMEGKKIA